jgi:hypothetical protein
MTKTSKNNNNNKRRKAPQQPRKRRTPQRKERTPRRARSTPAGGSAPANGSRIGHKIGHFLGGVAKGALKSVFGMGEYKVALGTETATDPSEIAESDTPAVNSLVTPISSASVPMMHANVEGTVRITRREFIGHIDIKDAPIDYNYKIQPANTTMFPWLSGISRSWQQYQFLGLAVEFVPTSGMAIGSSAQGPALGQVACAFKYNVAEPANLWPATSLQGMLNMQGSVSCSPAACSTCYMECDPSISNQPVRWVETEIPPTPGGFYSLQNYVAAEFLVRTEGAVSGNAFQAGQLWVTYDINLYNPRPVQPLIIAPWYEHKEYAPYVQMYRDLARMENCVGPYTDEELIAAQSIRRDLLVHLTQEKPTTAADLCEAFLERILAKTQDTSLLDPQVAGIIHASGVYRKLIALDEAEDFGVVPLPIERDPTAASTTSSARFY